MKVVRFLIMVVLVAHFYGFDAAGQDVPQYGGDRFGSSLKGKKEKRKKPDSSDPQASETEESLIRVDTKLVVDDVLVTDKKGAPVKGLSKSDFLLFENGVPQDLAMFAPGHDRNAIGRSVVLIIDYSASERPYIENSVEAAKVLIDGLNPQDRMAVVTDDIEVLSSFTTDRAQLKERLDCLKQRSLAGKFGKSLQFSSLMATLNELLGDDAIRSTIIFQTDGDEFMSLKHFVLPQGDMRGATRFTFEELIEAAERVRAAIYTIVPNSTYIGLTKKAAMEKAESELRAALVAADGSLLSGRAASEIKFQKQSLQLWADARKRDEVAIKQLAERTGGWSANITSPADAGRVYSQILQEFNKRYLVGYYPANQDNSGERRKIEIRIRNRPDYKVSGKKEYVVSR